MFTLIILIKFIYRLQSAKSMKNKTNWEQSKRFLFGSLLCFTSNKFQSLIFGTVVERDIKLLMDGYVWKIIISL